MLTCIRMVKENSTLYGQEALCLENQSQSILPQIPLGSFNMGIFGGLRSSLDAGDVGLRASVNSSVPKMAMRIEAGGNGKGSGFHSCCHQN